jgi:hypothetical protein
VSRSHSSAAGRFKDRVEPGNPWVHGIAAKELSQRVTNAACAVLAGDEPERDADSVTLEVFIKP